MCSGWIVQAWISMRWEHFWGYNCKIFMPPFRKYSNAGIHPGHWIPGSPSTLVSFNHDADEALFPTQVWWCHRLSWKRKGHPHPCVQSDPKIGALRIKELFPWEKHDQPLAHNGFEGQRVPLRDPKSLVSGPHSWVGMVQITEQGWGRQRRPAHSDLLHLGTGPTPQLIFTPLLRKRPIHRWTH